MKSAQHSVFNSVEVWVLNRDFVSSAKGCHIVVDTEEGIETVGTNDFAVHLIFDFASFHSHLQRFHHAFVSKPVIELWNNKVENSVNIGLSYTDETCGGYSAGVTISPRDSMRRNFSIRLSQHHVACGKAFSSAWLSEQGKVPARSFSSFATLMNDFHVRQPILLDDAEQAVEV